jgi:hypothetical protein
MTASPIQVARAKFVDDCWAIARALDENRVYGLGQAALRNNGETAQFWRGMSRRLVAWRDGFDASSVETRIVFDGLAGSLRADLTWASTCEGCCGEGEICAGCCQPDGMGECGGACILIECGACAQGEEVQP